jgi:uncharacterized protein (TIGR02284 family)
MERKAMLDRLNDLIQLDVDAVEAYGQAMKHIKYDDIRKKLGEFQDDHRHHIQRLTAAVREFGGEPVKPRPDLKGYLLQGFTALRSVTGTEGALRAMETNEKLTNRKYGEATELDLPTPVMRIVRDNLAQEEIHLTYIQETLSTPRREL